MIADAQGDPDQGFAAFQRLKEDGRFGPKTRAGLRQAVASLGRPKVEDALALGRFHDFARNPERQGFERLAEVTENAFVPLFRDTRVTAQKPTDRIEAVTLQETLNDLGRGRAEPLRLDGMIGPKTTRAFADGASTAGPETLTRRFGELLGFL